MGFFVYVILGTSKECSIGPTAVMSLMTFSYASEGGPIYSTLLAFLAGWLELAAGLLNLGMFEKGSAILYTSSWFVRQIYFFNIQDSWSSLFRPP